MTTKSSAFPNWGLRVPGNTPGDNWVPVKTTGTKNPGGLGAWFQGVELDDGRWLVVWNEDDEVDTTWVFQGYAEYDDLISMDDSVSPDGRVILDFSPVAEPVEARRRVTPSLCYGPDGFIYRTMLFRWYDTTVVVNGVEYTIHYATVELYRSRDQGETWDIVGSSASDTVTIDGEDVTVSRQALDLNIWDNNTTFGLDHSAGEMVEVPTSPGIWLFQAPAFNPSSATVIHGNVYRTEDRGSTWSKTITDTLIGTSSPGFCSHNFGYSHSKMYWFIVRSTSSGTGGRLCTTSSGGSVWNIETNSIINVRNGMPRGGSSHLWIAANGTVYEWNVDDPTYTPVALAYWPDRLVDTGDDLHPITLESFYNVTNQDHNKMVVWHDEGVVTFFPLSACEPPPRLKIPYPKWAYEGSIGPDNPDYLWQLNQNYSTVERICQATAASKCQLNLRRNPSPAQQEQNWYQIERWANDYVRTAGCMCTGAPPLSGKCYLWIPYKKWSTTDKRPAHELENWLSIERWIEYLQHSDCLQGG